MTTITSGLSTRQGWSPLQNLQNQLDKSVQAGSVKAEDQDALSAALTDIDTKLQAGATTSSGSASGPKAMKSQIDDLISGEVSDGKLTTDQATELKSVFAKAASHHAHGHRSQKACDDGDGDDAGQTGATASSGAASFSDFIAKLEASLTDAINAVTGTSASTGTDSAAAVASTSSDTSSSTASTASSDPKQLMLAFLKKLESSLSNSDTYSASGTNGATTAGQSVLVNALA